MQDATQSPPNRPDLLEVIREKERAELRDAGVSGFVIARIRWPGKKDGLARIRLPRAGRPPRRGVQIPRPVFDRVVHLGKHSFQQTRHGRFGGKGAKTVARKAEFLSASSRVANLLAAIRREQRNPVPHYARS